MSRHFVMTPIGSSGDVHPYIGLGAALRARGHDVTVLATEVFRTPVEGAGLRFVATVTEEEYLAVAADPDLWHPRRGVQFVLRRVGEELQRLYDRIDGVYEPGRTVLVGHMLALATRVFEETHRAPAATLLLAPSSFRSDFAQPAHVPGGDLSRLPVPAKRAMWWAIDRLMIDPHIAPPLNRWRAGFGLPPVSRVLRSWVHSPQCAVGLFPEWFAPPQPDWPRQLRLTGFPLFDERGQHEIGADLERFLSAGEPPLVFTPGSAHVQARGFFDVAIDAADRLGRRAVLLTRHRDQVPTVLPPHVRHDAYVPFSLILPRCAALVHHGGIGTCAQGLAAGIPQLTMPMGFDQPDNATRLNRLGVGGWVLPGQFSGPRVADALEPLLKSKAVRAACDRWSEVIALSRPVDATCDILERIGV
jgi:rhamnosyltransferase subunit B